eukprot:TRINITY_DN8539_c1_g1_i1.p1 TRINITY_DN8539_c1_g1~~TRINITY_DN8539_c1_g1_i1.p1  ORF type:complete len:122 (+),score=35.94 TRINITY_DN8539_c1_g1_i1:130-495(+)
MAALFNGFTRNQHIIASLTTKGPQTKGQLWESLKEVSGFRNKTEMKETLASLRKERRVKSMLDKGLNQESFIFKANNRRINYLEKEYNPQQFSREVPQKEEWKAPPFQPPYTILQKKKLNK